MKRRWPLGGRPVQREEWAPTTTDELEYWSKLAPEARLEFAAKPLQERLQIVDAARRFGPMRVDALDLPEQTGGVEV